MLGLFTRLYGTELYSTAESSVSSDTVVDIEAKCRRGVAIGLSQAIRGGPTLHIWCCCFDWVYYEALISNTTYKNRDKWVVVS